MHNIAWLMSVGLVVGGFLACSGDETETTPTTATGTGATGGGGTSTGGTGGGGAAPAICGNGVQEEGEECDDGNNVDADGCEADCTLPRCGNGIVDPGEVCWDGQWTTYLVQPDAPKFLIVADCNEDGHPDVLSLGQALEPVGSLTEISALLNDGTGHLGSEQVSGVVALDPRGFAAADIDGANGFDLVVATVAGGSPALRPMLGQNDCTYDPGTAITLSSAPRDVASLRLDGDLLDDFVAPVTGTGSPATPQLAYHLSTGLPTSFQTVGGGSNPTSIVAGAIDANGMLGVVYTDHDANKVVVRDAPGSGSLGTPSVVPANGSTGAGPTAVALGDVDGDLRPDIVTANMDADSVTVLLNGDNGFVLGGSDISVVGDGPVQGRAPWSITLVDVDHDGDLDVLTANVGTPVEPTRSVTLLLNDGAGSFDIATSTLFPLVEKSFPIELGGVPGEVAVADLNGDGAVDVITEVTMADPDASAVVVILANP